MNRCHIVALTNCNAVLHRVTRFEFVKRGHLVAGGEGGGAKSWRPCWNGTELSSFVCRLITMPVSQPKHTLTDSLHLSLSLSLSLFHKHRPTHTHTRKRQEQHVLLSLLTGFPLCRREDTGFVEDSSMLYTTEEQSMVRRVSAPLALNAVMYWYDRDSDAATLYSDNIRRKNYFISSLKN